MVVGAPGRDVDGVAHAGEVAVLEFEIQGSGIEVAEVRYWSEGHGIPGALEAEDQYGRALVVGDWNGDGVDDLAIGAPRESVGVATGAGAVALLWGEAGVGLEDTATLLTQSGLPGQQVQIDESFGARLAAGDFNGDGIDDLVIGVPGEARQLFGPGGLEWVAGGGVHVIQGGAAGLALATTKTWFGTPGDARGRRIRPVARRGALSRPHRLAGDRLADVGCPRAEPGRPRDGALLDAPLQRRLFPATGDTSRW